MSLKLICLCLFFTSYISCSEILPKEELIYIKDDKIAFEGEINKTSQRSFYIYNNGSKNLEIKKLSGSCSCNFPTIEKNIILPNDSSRVTINFTPKAIGYKVETLQIISNDLIKPSLMVFLMTTTK